MFTLLTDANNLDVLRKTLENNQKALLDNNLRIRVSDAETKKQVSRIIDNLFGEDYCRGFFMNQTLGQVADLFPKQGYILITNNSRVLPPRTIEHLLEDFLDHPNAGMISGWAEYSGMGKVEDIYDKEPVLQKDWVATGQRLCEADTIPLIGVMMKTRTFRDWYKASGDNLSLALRRGGYMNYIDTRLKYDWR